MKAQSDKKPPAPDSPAPTWTAAISRPGFNVTQRQSRPKCQHLPPVTFQPGQPIPLEVAVEAGYRFASVVLHYRHVDQSDEYRVVEMSADGGRYRATIPGEYTDSAYPLLYYFVLRNPQGAAWLHPGLNPDLANQPYFVVRHV